MKYEILYMRDTFYLILKDPEGRAGSMDRITNEMARDMFRIVGEFQSYEMAVRVRTAMRGGPGVSTE